MSSGVTGGIAGGWTGAAVGGVVADGPALDLDEGHAPLRVDQDEVDLDLLRRPVLSLDRHRDVGQDEHVVGEHDAEHRPAEHRQQAREPSHTVVAGLVHPFAMAFTPEGDLLYTAQHDGQTDLYRVDLDNPDYKGITDLFYRLGFGKDGEVVE